jgi:hypothetical protein
MTLVQMLYTSVFIYVDIVNYKGFINKYNIFEACEEGHTEIVELLLGTKIDVNSIAFDHSTTLMIGYYLFRVCFSYISLDCIQF